MSTYKQQQIAAAFDAHVKELHNADYECCPDPRCRFWYAIERLEFDADNYTAALDAKEWLDIDATEGAGMSMIAASATLRRIANLLKVAK